jgi:hypothetical protein
VWQVTNSLEQELAVEGAPGRRSKIADVGGRLRPAVGGDFKLFSKMPLAEIFKLLSNFL